MMRQNLPYYECGSFSKVCPYYRRISSNWKESCRSEHLRQIAVLYQLHLQCSSVTKAELDPLQFLRLFVGNQILRPTMPCTFGLADTLVNDRHLPFVVENCLFVVVFVAFTVQQLFKMHHV